MFQTTFKYFLVQQLLSFDFDPNKLFKWLETKTVFLLCFFNHTSWSYQFNHQTTSFGRLRPVSSLSHQSVTTKKLVVFNLQTVYHAFSWINYLLVLINDVSIVFCRATFNTLSTRQDIWYACLKIVDCKFFGCDWLMSPNEDKTGLSLPKLVVWWSKWYYQPYC